MPVVMPFTMSELTDNQMLALQDILCFYKEFNNELYNYPPEDTIFTQAQRELFTLFDIQ